MNKTQELLVEELRDLYDAEKQLVKALPKMAKASSNGELKQAFENHLEETRGHVGRLEKAFEALGEKPRSKPCKAMKGLLEEGRETMEEDLSEALLDSAIICAAQKVEHYEIAGYGSVSAWSRALGLYEVAELLEETLNEERAADEKLTEVGEPILAETISNSEEEEREGAPRKAAGSKTRSTSTPKRRAAGR